MTFSLKPQRLKRYRDIALLFLKHGRGNIVQASNLDQVLLEESVKGDTLSQGKPEQLTHDLEALGPTFIKLGQILSTRADLITQPYIDALSRLQDKVEPFSFEEAKDIISRELGVRLSKAFKEFSPKPIAAASLGQVHFARLRDGRPVAVKVQRPRIRQIILDDFDALDEIIGSIDQYTEIGRQYQFKDILDNFRRTLFRELDYRQEAENQITLARNLAGYPNIVVPTPIGDYTTSRVLTMDFIRGTKATALPPMTRLRHNTLMLAETLFKAYLDQVLMDGFFHADPHPGNVLVTEDGRIALLDFGMVATLDPRVQDNLLKLILAIADGRGHDAAQVCAILGQRLEHYDEAHFVRGVADTIGHYQSSNTEQCQEGRVMMELTRLAAEHGIRPAPELAILGKTLFNLDLLTRKLEPGFDPAPVLRQHGEVLMRKRMVKSLSPSSLMVSLIDSHKLSQQLPDRINMLLESLVRKEFELRVNAFDEQALLSSMQKIANRIALALVLAALIVGAAMMMEVESTLTLWGYPAVGIIMFMMAAGLGFGLVFTIMLKDKPFRRRRKRS